MDAYRLSACLATLLLGLMAGFFFAFAVDVAPAMAHLDASGYVTTQQWINRVVRNALFGGVYFGSTLLAFVPGLLALRERRRPLGAAWVVLALVYFGGVFWLTRSVNVPINEVVAQWNPAAPPAEWAALRERWNEANLWRAVVSALCFGTALLLVTAPGKVGAPA